MKVQRESWSSLSSYIFIDRKIDSSSTVFIKSRFNNLCDFMEKNNLEFNRSSVNLYLQSKKDEGCKNSYLNNILKVCQYVHEWMLLEQKYDSGCGKLTYFKKEKHIYEILTPEECRALYDLDYPYIRQRQLKNDRFQAILMMMTLTGMRIGEVLSIKSAEFTELAIYVRDTKTNADRVIPNNPLLFAKVEVYKKQRNEKNPYLFQGEDHPKMHKDAIRDDLKKRVSHLKIKKRVWMHLFRHSFCVEMLRHNDVTLVAKIMGHENLGSTLTYTHYLMDDLRHAVMSHPLLVEQQPFDTLTLRIQDFIGKVVDKRKNSVHIESSEGLLILKVKKLPS